MSSKEEENTAHFIKGQLNKKEQRQQELEEKMAEMKTVSTGDTRKLREEDKTVLKVPFLKKTALIHSLQPEISSTENTLYSAASFPYFSTIGTKIQIFRDTSMENAIFHLNYFKYR